MKRKRGKKENEIKRKRGNKRKRGKRKRKVAHFKYISVVFEEKLKYCEKLEYLRKKLEYLRTILLF